MTNQTENDADREHRKAINSAALDALLKLDLTRSQGVDVIVAIIRGQVPAVTINYGA